MNSFRLLVVVMVGSVLPQLSRADSIWDRREPRSAYLFVDTRPRQVGDLLTIVVRESTDIDNKDRRDLLKESTTGGVFSLSGNITGNSPTAVRMAEASLDTQTTSQHGIKGRSEYNVDQRFVDRVTVTVVDVLANGNLVIEGFRRRVISGEERILRISGVVRPMDVNQSNIIESQFVANFQVIYQGRGTESRFSNPGWLNKVLNRVWPF